MFKRIRRYLVFLCAFTLATANITDFNLLLEESSLEAASVEQDSVAQTLEENGSNDSYESAALEESVKDVKIEAEDSTVHNDDLDKAENTSEENIPDLIQGTEEGQEIPQDEFDLLEAGIENDTSLKTVSYYIHKYQKLPPLYITKKEAFELGGTLDEVLIQNSIGGDYFGNYQGILPVKEGRSYKECDIDTLGSDSRGKKRLVYSNDGLMYYTDDHYATFTLLYSNWNGTKLQNL